MDKPAKDKAKEKALEIKEAKDKKEALIKSKKILKK